MSKKPVIILGTSLFVIVFTAALLIVNKEAFDNANTKPDIASASKQQQKSTSVASSQNRNQEYEKTIMPASMDPFASNDPDQQARYDKLTNNSDYPTPESRLLEISARRPAQRLTQSQLMEALEMPTAWEQLQDVPEGLNLTSEERYDGREFIQFYPNKIESLVAGDTMEIPIWQLNETYEMKVERVEVHNDGSVSWKGRLINFEKENQVSITKGETLTVAGITTPSGQYVLQAHGDKGWIASSDTLFKYDPDETDMVFPEDQPMASTQHTE